jgi:hypothetical protein
MAQPPAAVTVGASNSILKHRRPRPAVFPLSIAFLCVPALPSAIHLPSFFGISSDQLDSSSRRISPAICSVISWPLVA